MAILLILDSSTKTPNVRCRDDVRGDVEEMFGHDRWHMQVEKNRVNIQNYSLTLSRA